VHLGISALIEILLGECRIAFVAGMAPRVPMRRPIGDHGVGFWRQRCAVDGRTCLALRISRC